MPVFQFCIYPLKGVICCKTEKLWVCQCHGKHTTAKSPSPIRMRATPSCKRGEGGTSVALAHRGGWGRGVPTVTRPFRRFRSRLAIEAKQPKSLAHIHTRPRQTRKRYPLPVLSATLARAWEIHERYPHPIRKIKLRPDARARKTCEQFLHLNEESIGKKCTENIAS